MTHTLTKILVIDDDIDTLAIVTLSLEVGLKGVAVKCMSSGEAGIREALTFAPDIILLDEMMPHMDGLTTLRGMRLFPQLARTPVIFFTAKVQPDEIESFLHAGAVDVITKPFDPNALGSRILAIWNRLTT